MDKRIIIEAIESTDTMIPHIPGLLEYLSFPDVKASVTRISDPAANKVSNARLTDDNAADVIDQVFRYYSNRHLAFSWVVGPTTTPTGINVYLEKAGMKKTCGVDGMYLPTKGVDIPEKTDVTIVQQPVSDPEPSIKIMAEAFPMTMESSRHLHELISGSEPPLKSRIYLVYMQGSQKPVACCYMTYLYLYPVALLCGAATLPDYRGKGLYTTMLARRLADARADGIETLIVLADQASSAPICKKAGFIKVCGLEIYSWTPQKERKPR